MTETGKIVDLTHLLENNKHWVPWWGRNVVKYRDHKHGKLAVRLVFGLPSKYLKTRLGWALEYIKMSTHGVTHMDAPWHYGPVSNGKRSRTIDEVPLEWCFSDGVVLDLRHKRDGEEVGVNDLKAALLKIGYTIKPMDIVLVHTGNDRSGYGTGEYFTKGSGVSAEATRWIVDQGVKVVGIDSWTWGLPLSVEAARAKKSGRDDIFWASHYVGLEKEYCHLEQLTNLDKLPPFGFKISCFPLKVKNGSGGPARVVAIIDE